jgi:hypothetical protein
MIDQATLRLRRWTQCIVWDSSVVSMTCMSPMARVSKILIQRVTRVVGFC